LRVRPLAAKTLRVQEYLPGPIGDGVLQYTFAGGAIRLAHAEERWVKIAR